MRVIIVIIFIVILWSTCSSEEKVGSDTYSDDDVTQYSDEEPSFDNQTQLDNETSEFDIAYSTDKPLYIDETYEYEYRTGVSGDYQYNYDVSGTDTYSYEDITGNLDMYGKYGTGYIENEEGEEIYVDAEWTDYGVIEASDDEGNTYELEVE